MFVCLRLFLTLFTLRLLDTIVIMYCGTTIVRIRTVLKQHPLSMPVTHGLMKRGAFPKHKVHVGDGRCVPGVHVSQVCNGWLNEVQSQNILNMLVTDEVFQVCNGWLNEVQPQNILAVSVTDEVSQSAMDSSNSLMLRNNTDISVINEVSQVPMIPCLRSWCNT